MKYIQLNCIVVRVLLQFQLVINPVAESAVPQLPLYLNERYRDAVSKLWVIFSFTNIKHINCDILLENETHENYNEYNWSISVHFNSYLF